MTGLSDRESSSFINARIIANSSGWQFAVWAILFIISTFFYAIFYANAGDDQNVEKNTSRYFQEFSRIFPGYFPDLSGNFNVFSGIGCMEADESADSQCHIISIQKMGLLEVNAVRYKILGSYVDEYADVAEVG